MFTSSFRAKQRKVTLASMNVTKTRQGPPELGPLRRVAQTVSTEQEENIHINIRGMSMNGRYQPFPAATVPAVKRTPAASSMKLLERSHSSLVTSGGTATYVTL